MPRSEAEKKPRPSFKERVCTALSVEQIYVLWAAFLVLAGARLFYGSLRMQTEHVSLWFGPEQFQALVHGAQRSLWSAPLDDVFIHFDFARATARGYPFEWIEGNGYSSGGTSLLYPFVLAAGYLAGFTGLHLFHWAAIVACVGTFATLLGARRSFRNLPPWTSLLLPPALLSVGALNWTLYSGMEVAMFLALWAMCFAVWDEFLDSILAGQATRLSALIFGICCAFLVAGRPEAAPLVAVFGFTCAWAWAKQKKYAAAVSTLILVGAPGALVVIGHMVANKLLTGDSAAAGALAKLEMHHPYLTGDQVFGSWVHFLKYQFLRLSDYHFSSFKWGVFTTGYFIWPVALLSIVFKKTRRYGSVLMLSVLIWFCLIALNGQVRWQNERYTMPAVAWLLIAAALGLGATIDWALASERKTSARYGSLIPLVAVTALFIAGQAERMREQVWFFGRASRNILEQHVRAASYLAEVKPPRHRILLSDAGALPYVSDLPAFDLIGLGGYGGLPIAGASRQGVGAAIELLEYVPQDDLPDIMALYPSWWSDFVLWFGRQVAEFPVRGNVICGGASKVIYAPLWQPILHSSSPMTIAPEEKIIDTLDVADVLSERAHEASWNREAQGYVGMKMLPDARDPSRDLWDAGRLLSFHMELSFWLEGFTGSETDLLLRVAPSQKTQVEITTNGKVVGTVDIEAADDWQEVRVPVGKLNGRVDFMIRPTEGELHVYHLFAVEGGASAKSSP